MMSPFFSAACMLTNAINYSGDVNVVQLFWALHHELTPAG